MVLGIFSNLSSVETLLNNLEEADFDSKDISLIMKDDQMINQIADVSGPLTGQFDKVVNKLKQLGVSDDETHSYQQQIEQGGAIVCISNPKAETAAQQMLQDAKALNIKLIKTK